MVKRKNKWNDCLLEVENPTDNQLLYLKDLYNKETLIRYMRKWEYKFNTRMTDKDYKQYRHEIELLQLDSFEVLATFEDYGFI